MIYEKTLNVNNEDYIRIRTLLSLSSINGFTKEDLKELNVNSHTIEREFEIPLDDNSYISCELCVGEIYAGEMQCYFSYTWHSADGINHIPLGSRSDMFPHSLSADGLEDQYIINISGDGEWYPLSILEECLDKFHFAEINISKEMIEAHNSHIRVLITPPHDEFKWTVRFAAAGTFDRWSNSIAVEKCFNTIPEVVHYLNKDKESIYMAVITQLTEDILEYCDTQLGN